MSDHSRSVTALFKTIVTSRQVSTYHTEHHQTIAHQHLAGADARAGDMQDVDAVQAASQRGFRLRLVDDAAPLVVRTRIQAPGKAAATRVLDFVGAQLTDSTASR